MNCTPLACGAFTPELALGVHVGVAGATCALPCAEERATRPRLSRSIGISKFCLGNID